MFFIQLRKYTFYGLGKLSACLNLLLHKKMEGKEYSNHFAISSLNQKRIHFSWPRVNSFRTTCRLTWFSIGLHCFNVGNTHRSNTKKYQEQCNQKVKRIHFKYQSNFYSYWFIVQLTYRNYVNRHFAKSKGGGLLLALKFPSILLHWKYFVV